MLNNNHLVFYNFYLTYLSPGLLLNFNIWVIFMPKINEIPQKTGILKFFNGSNKIDGPGHSPPIPQPKPNNKAPIISDESIFPVGSINFY